MNQVDNLTKEIRQIATSLGDEHIERIDFDRLIEILEESRLHLAERSRIDRELHDLKDEIRCRILGMLKANLACRFHEREADTAVRLSDESADLGAGELIVLYNKTAAAFRDNFPSTFKYIALSNDRFNQDHTWSDYKI